MKQVSEMVSVSSRLAGFIFVHQLNRVRILGGGVDNWLNDLYEIYAYYKAVEKLAYIGHRVTGLSVEFKQHQMASILDQLKSGIGKLSLDEIKMLLVDFYELTDEIEALTGVTTDLEDDNVQKFIDEVLVDGDTG